MLHLTFDNYKKLNGKVEDESSFTVLEKRAELKLGFFLQKSLDELETIPQQVEDLLFLYVNILADHDGLINKQLNSYSNGDESFSYAQTSQMELNNSLYTLAKEYLFGTELFNLLYRGGGIHEYL